MDFQNGTCLTDRLSNLYNLTTDHLKITKYSTTLCHNRCLAEMPLKECGCSGYRRALLYQQICNFAQARNCIEALPTDKNCLMKCTPPCDELEYLIHLSFQKYPVESQNADRNGFLTANFYFRRMEKQIREESLRYGIEDFKSNIGGYMGLFSGYSILTLVEFVSFVFVATGYYKYNIYAVLDLMFDFF